MSAPFKTTHSSSVRRAVVAALGAAAVGTCLPALAQNSQSTDPDDPDFIEEIVTTGTAVERTEFETPQTVTQYSEEELRLFSSSSQADLLTQLPGA